MTYPSPGEWIDPEFRRLQAENLTLRETVELLRNDAATWAAMCDQVEEQQAEIVRLRTALQQIADHDPMVCECPTAQKCFLCVRELARNVIGS